jgi:prevent-host-death family protein
MPTLGAREARNHFARLPGSVHYGEQTVIVERSGKPMVAIIPVEMYQRLVAEREARFQVLDRIRSAMPEVPQVITVHGFLERLAAEEEE